MTAEEIIRRVAEQSTLFCFEPDEVDKSGKVIKHGKRITTEDVGKALDEIIKKHRAGSMMEKIKSWTLATVSYKVSIR